MWKFENPESTQEYGHLILQAKNRKDLCRLSHNPQRYTLYRLYKAGIIKQSGPFRWVLFI